MQKEKGISNSS